MLEWIQRTLVTPAGDSSFTPKPIRINPRTVLVVSGVFLALAAIFSVPLPLILLPFAAAGVMVLFFLRPTWGIIIAVFLLSIKRLFSVFVGIIPLFTVNRALIFWVVTCFLLHRFVLKTREQIYRHDQNKIALLFGIWYTISTILALDKRYAFQAYDQAMGNLLFFFLIYQLIENKKQLGTLFLGYIALLPASGLLSIIGYKLTGSQIFGKGGLYLEGTGMAVFRASGVAGLGPNNFAVVAVLFTIVLAVLLWWRDLRHWHRGVILTFIFGYLYMLSQTLSRTGMLLFILGMVMFLTRFWKRIGLRRIAIGGLALGLILTMLITDRVVERFKSISDVQGLILSEDQSISNRIGLTLLLPKLVAMRPVFGVGPANIAYLTSKSEYRGYVARNLKGEGFLSHNQYVMLIGELGIIGFAIFVLLMGLCVRDLLASRRMVADSEGTFLWCLVEALTLIVPLYFLAAATLDLVDMQVFWITFSMPIIIRRLLEQEAAAADGGLVPESSPHSPSPASD